METGIKIFAENVEDVRALFQLRERRAGGSDCRVGKKYRFVGSFVGWGKIPPSFKVSHMRGEVASLVSYAVDCMDMKSLEDIDARVVPTFRVGDAYHVIHRFADGRFLSYSSVLPQHRMLAAICVVHNVMRDPLKYDKFAKHLWKTWGDDETACLLINWVFHGKSDDDKVFVHVVMNYLLDEGQKKAVYAHANVWPYIYTTDMLKPVMDAKVYSYVIIDVNPSVHTPPPAQ